MARTCRSLRAIAVVPLAVALSAGLLVGSAGALDRTSTLLSKPEAGGGPDTSEVSFGRASRDGRRVFLETTAKLTADDTDTNRRDIYERAGGVTTLVSKPTGVADPDSADAFLNAVSADGSRAFFTTAEKLATADGDPGDQDVYERTGGATTLVSQPTGALDPETHGVSFAGISQDGSRVFFETSQPMTGDDGDSNRSDLYERAGGVTTLVSKPTGVDDPDTDFVSFQGTSQDGSRVFFTTNEKLVTADGDPGDKDVYERAGGITTLVSQPTGALDPETHDVFFAGISQDGSRVFFATSQPMTGDDGDSNRSDLYERAGGVTTLVSQPTGVDDPDMGDVDFQAASQDGDRVFFTTSQKLTASDNDTGFSDVYERAGGTTTLVSQPTGVADPDIDDVSFSNASQDGSRVLFTTIERLTASDNDTGFSDVYERAGGTTMLVSQPTGVADPDGGAADFTDASQDGSRVFFQTSQPMTGDDLDSSRGDIYERAGGVTTLVSEPAGVADPDTSAVSLRGLSQDGSRVFLVTTQKMTADDTDAGHSDVYVALPPPTATTAAATGVGSGSATLHGTVNPSGLATSYRFDIGKSTAYGGQTPSVSAGGGDAAVAAAQVVGGLEPNTTYHFRVRATNPSGTVVGADRTFTTTSAGAGGGGGGGGVVVLPEKANLRGVTKTIKVAGSRRFKLSFRATPGLTGTATFPSAKKVGVSKRQKVTLARKSFRVPASGKVTLKVELSKKSFRILKRNRKIEVRLKVTLKNPAGATSTARKTITLEAPKRRRR